ncbi:lysozyme C, milk isozyme-like [Podarcis lilfordi]|uniref:Lysozyme C, milk isozyme-like n=1 Tax=Podarcis lilfordi TaxID=74358 RepID=A0AA35LH55_9SAUR|nr:lysozyme C, milk isozyme-like [Podarcis lilfordi]
MMKALWLLPLLTGLLATGEGLVLGRCALAQRLQQLGLDGYAGYSLANWVCTACHESSYNTSATHYNDYDGSTDFGIFQINSRYWCQDGSQPSSNMCRIQCSELLTDNVAPDVACAKIVVDNSEDGMGAWVAWRLYCQGRDLSQYVAGCNV